LLNFKIFKKPKLEIDPLKEIVAKIRDGDKDLNEKFINDYKPFISHSVSKVLGRFINPDDSEEFSIGLIAFNEAIKSYDEGSNRNFLSFADQVINRRVIDFLRKQSRTKNEYPFTYFENEENNHFEEKYLVSQTRVDNVEVEEEIFAFKDELFKHGITLASLVQCAPKHKDSKQLCMSLARLIAENQSLYDKFKKTGNIPMTELMKVTDVYHGTVERNRKYIIAMIVIMKSKMEILQGYIKDVEKGGKRA